MILNHDQKNLLKRDLNYLVEKGLFVKEGYTIHFGQLRSASVKKCEEMNMHRCKLTEIDALPEGWL